MIKFYEAREDNSQRRFKEMEGKRYSDEHGSILSGAIYNDDETVLFQFHDGWLHSPNPETPSISSVDGRYMAFHKRGVIHRDGMLPAVYILKPYRDDGDYYLGLDRSEFFCNGMVTRIQDVSFKVPKLIPCSGW